MEEWNHESAGNEYTISIYLLCVAKESIIYCCHSQEERDKIFAHIERILGNLVP